MRSLRHPSQADLISRYRNAAVGGATADELAQLAVPIDPALLAVIDRIRRARTRHLPDPVFIARLELDAVRVFQASFRTAGPAVTLDPARRPGDRSSGVDRPHAGLWPRPLAGLATLVRPAIGFATALVLIAITAVFAWTFFERQNDTQLIAPSAVVTIPTDQQSTPVATPGPLGAPGAGINVVNADGSGLGLLVDDPTSTGPGVSPDGSKIAYAAEDGIFVMDADGSEPTLIVDLPRDPEALQSLGMNTNPGRVPSWSPDGTMIAYADAAGAIYLAGADGSNPTKIVDPQGQMTDGSFMSVDGYVWRPAWSPDGDRLAVVSGFGGARRILLVEGIRLGDPVVTALTDLAGDLTAPSWTPDGAALVFFVTNAEENDGVYLVTPGDGAPRRVSEISPYPESSPSWSPDGTRLLVATQEAVWMVNADGSGSTQFTAIPGGAQAVAWSPDGEKIAFVADGNPYVVNLDGTGLRRLANVYTDSTGLVWSSDGSRLIFTGAEG